MANTKTLAPGGLMFLYYLDITPVENQFILEYLPGAKGDYIKVQIEIHSESLVDVYGALSHAEEITFIPITVKKSG